MRIGVLLDPYNEANPSGLGRSIFEMAKALLAADTANSYTVYFKKTLEAHPALPGVHWSAMSLNAKYLWLTGAFNMDRTLDAYIFFTPVIPLFFRPQKSLVVALDFAYLALPAHTIKDRLSARLLYRIHKRSLKLATKIIAISTQTKEDAVRYFGIVPGKIEVVPIGYIEPPKELEEVAVPEKFFLFAGVLKGRKNVVGVIKAFAQFAQAKNNTSAGYHLVITGKKSGPYADMLQKTADDLGVDDRVHFLGYVTNAQLAYLYSKAEALVFPSFIEGFGMPVLEAMSVGLPVITSNQGALAEVAGIAALLVDPHDTAAIAEAMGTIAGSIALREELIVKGYERVRQFNWAKTAQRFVKSIEELK